MAFDFCCSAECQVRLTAAIGANGTKHWSFLTGAVPMALSTTNPRTGTRCWQANTTTGAPIEHVRTQSVAERGWQFYLRPDTLPSADCNIFCLVGAADYVVRYIAATGKLRWQQDGNAGTEPAGGETTSALTSGAYNRIRLWVDINQNPWDLRVAVGTDTPVTWAPANAASTFSDWKVGINCSAITTANGDLKIDDIESFTALADFTGLTDAHVIALSPTGDGTHVGLTAGEIQRGTISGTTWTAGSDVLNATTDAYLHIDDPVGAPGTDGIKTLAAVDATDYFEVTFADATGETAAPRNVTLLTTHRNVSGTAANKHSARVFDGTTETSVFADVSVGTTANTPYGYDVTTPFNTLAKLNGARLRWGNSWGTVDSAPEPIILAAQIEASFPDPAGGGGGASKPFYYTTYRRSAA